MTTEKIFRTKTGFCHILPDRIVLTRDGIIGNISKVTVGNNIARILIIYGLIACGLFYFAYNEYVEGQTMTALLFSLFALYLIMGIVRSMNNSSTPVIERQKIRDVSFKKAIPGLIRSHFIVYFEDENGKVKKRLIMLPGSMTGGKTETEKAMILMKEEKLID